ncbi:hypothetical protein ES332_D12G044400v1 [Gossypium tomentosum]|uniref:YbaK/aminoacyl-tRNA synthetase-associated domain-containing protein n=1 Tax=Gossypium tomentosum TaxID=34277 RepID=A0A5D2I4R0_GOSTO|nr:hypothetical protein ES332_D12G044400v1 [Gossypium tomentosum]
MRIEMKMIKEINERTGLVILISPRRQRKEERTKKFSLHAVSSIREELQIEFSQYEHHVVLTVEAQAKYVGNLGGALSNNLFLKDKKQRYYVVFALADTKVDLKEDTYCWLVVPATIY